MISLKHPHPNHNTAQPASADCLRLLWPWLQDHCNNGTHRLVDVYQIHGNRIAHNDVTHALGRITRIILPDSAVGLNEMKPNNRGR